jgi:GntR family transcriptional regulator, transcriptional repressor for pyruvate dehydrogenase complex
MRADLTFGRAKDLRPAFTTAGASENAARFIRAMIFSGELGPGDRLPPSRDLAVRLGISIVTLRVALKSLEVAGYIVTSRGARGGSSVSDRETLSRCWSAWVRERAEEVDEICELRDTIEVRIAWLAAERRSTQELGAIEVANTLLVEKGSSVLRWNVAFHDALARAAHNRRLERAMVEVRGELFLPVDAFLRQHRVEELAAAHGAVLDAVRRQDAEAAAASMRAHLAETQAVIKLALEEARQV